MKFIKIDGVDKYQDFWLQLKDATNSNFQSDMGILNKIQEELDSKLKEVIKEKERIFEIIQFVNSGDGEGK